MDNSHQPTQALQLDSESRPLPCVISWLLYLRLFQFALAASIMSLAAFSWSRLNDVSWEIIVTVFAVYSTMSSGWLIFRVHFP